MQINIFIQEFANQCFGDMNYTLNLLAKNFKSFYTSQMLFSAGGCKLGITSFKC